MSQAARFGARHITRGIGRMSQHVLKSGRGAFVMTDEGKRLLDMTSYVEVSCADSCPEVLVW